MQYVVVFSFTIPSLCFQNQTPENLGWVGIMREALMLELSDSVAGSVNAVMRHMFFPLAAIIHNCDMQLIWRLMRVWGKSVAVKGPETRGQKRPREGEGSHYDKASSHVCLCVVGWCVWVNLVQEIYLLVPVLREKKVVGKRHSSIAREKNKRLNTQATSHDSIVCTNVNMLVWHLRLDAIYASRFNSAFLTASTSSLFPHIKPPRSSVSATCTRKTGLPVAESRAAPPAHSRISAMGASS
jgi:hypothetical protein